MASYRLLTNMIFKCHNIQQISLNRYYSVRCYSSLFLRMNCKNVNLIKMAESKDYLKTNHFRRSLNTSAAINKSLESTFKIDPMITFAPSESPAQSTETSQTPPSTNESLTDSPPTVSDPNVIDLSGFTIPEAPSASTDIGSVISDAIINNAETLSQLNIASSWTPVGWVMHFLDFLHASMPWCASIVVATITFRTLMFPLVIKAQKNAAKMNAILPQLQVMQQKMNNARLSGNAYDVAKFTHEYQTFMKNNDISPFKSLLVPMAQAPVFISFFLCLRRMAELPVESLKTGGILWFPDLTIPDPYYLLPLITCTTLWAALEIGVESGVTPDRAQMMKWIVRGMPVFMLIFIYDFSGAILTYWCSSNIISLIQVLILKQTRIREYFGIPRIIKYKPEDMPVKPKGFIEGFKDSWEASKITKKVNDRQRIDEINFKKSAIGPIKKTYKYDPTKVRHEN